MNLCIWVNVECSFNWAVRLISSWPLETSWSSGPAGISSILHTNIFLWFTDFLYPQHFLCYVHPRQWKPYLLLDLGIFRSARVFWSRKEEGWMVTMNHFQRELAFNLTHLWLSCIGWSPHFKEMTPKSLRITLWTWLFLIFQWSPEKTKLTPRSSCNILD